jgi:hypothetical protein
MTYILTEQRHADDAEATRLWSEYRKYISENEPRFPPYAYAIASSSWYYGNTDPRSPHDAWLESYCFEESAEGARHERRSLSLTIKLRNAFHDRYLKFFYPLVYAYTLSSISSQKGHGDWRYDEFTLTDDDHLLHEIEWIGWNGAASRWLIEASDLVLTTDELRSTGGSDPEQST